MANKLKELLLKRKSQLKEERLNSWVFKPRNYQKNLISKYEEGVRFFLICWARRLGKKIALPTLNGESLSL